MTDRFEQSDEAIVNTKKCFHNETVALLWKSVK